jgi:DNA-binding transcriptional LysR family regulator
MSVELDEILHDGPHAGHSRRWGCRDLVERNVHGSGRLLKRLVVVGAGRLVWREPLLWAAAETFDLIPGAALPLALYRERSISREAALAALNDSELTWEIIYTSPSLTGVRAAALAGLAITPLPASALIAGLRILGVEEGLPPLPDLEFAIYEKARADKAATTLAAALLTLAPGLLRPSI